MNTSSSQRRMPAVFFGHGSPGNVLEDNYVTRAWERLGREIPRPKGIICISAHWLTRGVKVMANEKPRTIHDFGGFPEKMFRMRYPASGDPGLAAHVIQRLSGVGAAADTSWGYDHGSWCVLLKAYPEADIPLIQLSIDYSQPPEFHYKAGRLLAPFRDEGILVMGSGNIVHNLPEMDWRQKNGAYPWAAEFGDYIRESIVNDEPQNLVGYESQGRAARLSVPSPDHYLPLLYVMGTRQTDDTVRFETPMVEYGSLDMTSVVLGG